MIIWIALGVLTVFGSGFAYGLRVGIEQGKNKALIAQVDAMDRLQVKYSKMANNEMPASMYGLVNKGDTK